jgi:transcriptional regulator with XRE-family HTH domain
MEEEFGTRLKNLRNAKKMTQKELAETIGVNQKQCQHWERGRAEPGFDKLQRLAHALGVRIEWLLYGNGRAVSHDDEAASLIKQIEAFLKYNPHSLPIMKKMFTLFMSEYKRRGITK